MRPSVTYSGISAGFSMMAVHAFAKSSWRFTRCFSQKVEILSFLGIPFIYGACDLLGIYGSPWLAFW